MSISSQTALLVAAVANLTSGLKTTFFPQVGGAVAGPVYTTPVPVAFSATPTFDATLSNVFHFGVMTAAVTAAIFQGGADGQTINVRIEQDATGGRTFALPANVVIKGTFNTNASAVNWLVLTWKNSTAKWEAVWS
jgi:hypothetical protein